jgi:hypothetical protein
LTAFFLSDIILNEVGDLMEERVQISILLDYYGMLFTEKQFNIMNLYYNQDFSLAEIAELNKTSRQATFDVIKKCHIQLFTYEKMLNLSAINNIIEDNKALIIKKLENINDKKNPDIIQDIINDIRNLN